MEKQQIIENNKLIAEFMGWKWEVKDHFGINLMKSPEGKGADVKGMKFHSSWDWLMPVISKIYELNEYFDFILETSGQFENKIEINTKFISVTYETVIEFIEWYNENK